jgi:hypothetical protein
MAGKCLWLNTMSIIIWSCGPRKTARHFRWPSLRLFKPLTLARLQKRVLPMCLTRFIGRMTKPYGTPVPGLWWLRPASIVRKGGKNVAFCVGFQPISSFPPPPPFVYRV